MDLVKEGYRKKGATIIKNLSKRHIEGYYCETKEEALTKAMSLIKDTDTVSWGGSATIDEIGLKSVLKEQGVNLIDRDMAKTPEERTELMRKALLSDCFLMSTNAITMDGELINIDGNGNRVAALCFGPGSVIVIAGMNKVVSNVEDAVNRIKTDACVPNSIRFGLKTPCALTGKCSNCLEESICGQIVVTRLSKVKNRIKVILVGESLGF